MQNTWLRSKSLLGAVAACSLLSIDAYGQSQGELIGSHQALQIRLRGEVPLVCRLVVHTGRNSGIDISVTEAHRPVGSVEEICNDPNGYTVTVTTANGTTSGLLKSAAAKDEMAYQFKYGRSAVTLTDKSAVVTNATEPSIKSNGRGDIKLIEMIFTGSSSNLHANDYTDTLTFTIAAK